MFKLNAKIPTIMEDKYDDDKNNDVEYAKYVALTFLVCEDVATSYSEWASCLK